jgi:hypothetical protein
MYEGHARVSAGADEGKPSKRHSLGRCFVVLLFYVEAISALCQNMLLYSSDELTDSFIWACNHAEHHYRE